MESAPGARRQKEKNLTTASGGGIAGSESRTTDFESLTPEEIKARVKNPEDPIHGYISSVAFNVVKKIIRDVADQGFAEDVAQDTVIKVLKKIDQFNSESKLRVWIYRIALNTYISYKRSGQFSHVSHTDSLDEMSEYSSNLPTSNLSPNEKK